MDEKEILEKVREQRRLELLNELSLLDTPVEEAFDRLTRLAGKILDAPVSLVSIVDANRQFFKSLLGLPDEIMESRETPLSHSFCKHVVATGDRLVIEDARQDPVLKDNLAIPDLDVIAYLGMPLTTEDGVELGSFCVIDSKPRQWSEEDQEIVQELAASVMTEITLRAEIKERKKIEEALNESNRRYRRAYRFANSTLESMKETINRGSSRGEMLTYVDQMKEQLEKI